MDELKHGNTFIRVKRKHVFLLQEYFEKIRSLFSVHLSEIVPKQEFSNPYVVFFNVQIEHCEGLPDNTLISKIQVRKV